METGWQIHKIPTLKDNFVFILANHERAIVIDPGEAAPVIQFLKTNKLVCETILITHHHWDHTNGVVEIAKQYDCEVYGPLKEESKLDYKNTKFLKDGETLKLDGIEFQIIELAGHTMGHIAYWQVEKKWLFSGDVLFALGCGRVFEGTYENMFEALGKIKSLPDDALIFCAHDYYQNNKKFCDQYEISLHGYHEYHPLKLGQEKAFNPFLAASDIATFRNVRDLRNAF